MAIICNIETDTLTNFFNVIDTCSGQVSFISLQGKRYNLKSYISRYIALTKINNMPNFLVELSDISDLKKLDDFIKNKGE